MQNLIAKWHKQNERIQLEHLLRLNAFQFRHTEMGDFRTAVSIGWTGHKKDIF